MGARSIRRQHIRTLPKNLQPVPQDEWPQYRGDVPPIEVWRSRRWVVQVYPSADGVTRVSVRRSDGRDGITWDQLQAIKGEIGRGDVAAVELFPPDRHVVAVANMRHLWLLDDLPAWAWRCRSAGARP